MESKFKIFVIVAIVVLALAIGASTFLVLRVMNNSTVNDVATKNEEKVVELKEVELGDAILTNITAETGNVQHFAKVKISIGVDGSDEKAFTSLGEKIASNAASVRSEIITTIGEQTYSMLSATNGKEKLADEIVPRLNALLDTELIYKVYYQEFFIQ